MTDQTVTIAGRTFRIGATYAPKPKDGATRYRRKTLLRVRPPSMWNSEPMVYWLNKNGREEWSTAKAWLRWAGEEVPDA